MQIAHSNFEKKITLKHTFLYKPEHKDKLTLDFIDIDKNKRAFILQPLI